VLGCLWLYEGGRTHEWLGYGALGVAALRTLAGIAGTAPDSPARFARFVRGPSATWAYARAVARGRETRHLGHNPLGAWMIVALLACALLAGATGALYVTDRWWGDEAMITTHALAGWALLALLPLHVGGAVFTSRRHRENLVRAMVDGRKRAPSGDDVPA
jgi:cytochrome b